jgi:hypothetical protein
VAPAWTWESQPTSQQMNAVIVAPAGVGIEQLPDRIELSGASDHGSPQGSRETLQGAGGLPTLAGFDGGEARGPSRRCAWHGC